MKTGGLKFLGSSLVLLGLLVLSFVPAFAGEITLVTPTGSVKTVQQVRVLFSTDMAAVGDPRAKVDPLKLECKAVTKGSSIARARRSRSPAPSIPAYATRWTDSKNWSLNFDKPLASGVRCTLKLVADVKDLAGQPVTGLNEYSFSTSGPSLLGVSPRHGNVEPEQYFVLRLDGEVDRASVQRLAYFEAENLPDRIGVHVVDNLSQRGEILRVAIRDDWEFSDVRSYVDSKESLNLSGGPLKDFIIIAGNRRFPEGAKLVLHWPEGILSKSGLPVENPQSFTFRVLPPFDAEFKCERANPNAGCNPILSMQVQFTNRVKLELLKQARLVAVNGGQTWTPVEMEQAGRNKNFGGEVGQKAPGRDFFNVITNFADKEVDALTFSGPFPPKATFQLILPPGIKDEIGRPLENAGKFPLTVATDDHLPLVKFAAPFGLLERTAAPALPVSVRNVEVPLPGRKMAYEGKDFVLGARAKPSAVIGMIRSLNEKEYNYDLRRSPLLKAEEGMEFSLPVPGGKGGKGDTSDFQLVGIPLATPGLHVVEVRSERLGESLLGSSAAMYVASGALVTDLSVHFKKGRESSLVWVTHLSNAKPVEGAEVALYSESGKELARGRTDNSGVWRVGGVRYPCSSEGAVAEENSCEVYAFAKKGDDFSLASSVWFRGIEQYRFNLKREWTAPQWGPIVAHAIADRAIVQAGETIHLKHVLREHTGKGFRSVSSAHMPKRVLIVHSGSHKTYSLPFLYDPATGSAVSDFSVPKDAALGLYEIYLSKKSKRDKGGDRSGGAGVGNEESDGEGDIGTAGDPDSDFDWSAKSTGQFMVSEYRLPLMTSTVKISGDPLIQPKEVKVDLSAAYLLGGPAEGLKVKIRSVLERAIFAPDFPGGGRNYVFFSRPVRPGVQSEAEVERPDRFLFTQDLELGAGGGAVTAIKGLPPLKDIRTLVVEMEYRDPNGEVKTASQNSKLYPSDVIVGLSGEDTYGEAGKVGVTGVITDHNGKFRPKESYSVEAFSREYVTHRKRLVGGFYAYDSKTRVKSLGRVCKGESDEHGRFRCVPSLPSGSVILQAAVSDSKGRTTYASVNMEVFGEGGERWWTPSDSDRIDLIPEKSRYEPGETAKLLVRSPFPTSTVLLTIEREGILESFTREITRDNPWVDVPVQGRYAPNVFVSALALRGRVGEPAPTALIDLARPAMKLGMSELRVGWKAHELKVRVDTDRKRYHARDKVDVTVKVATASGGPLPAGAEIALVAVDEALQRLRRNWSVELLSAMMGQRALEVDTSSSQNLVIGRRHFGSKAKPPGGGGGAGEGGRARELFAPVLMWNPHVKLDAKGSARLSVPLNDSLTEFQIEAVAQAGMDYFGDGSAHVESTKDLILYSGFAPVVRGGDKISNSLTLRNTTPRTMQVALKIGCPQLSSPPSERPRLELKPNESKTIAFKMEIPEGPRQLDYEISATDKVGGVTDVLKFSVRVDEAVPVRVQQATLFQLTKEESFPVKQPEGSLPGRGGLRISSQPSLVRGLSGVRAYMEDYPYTCLEQKVSKAIALENRTETERLIQQLPGYFDHNGLLKFFPSSACGSEQLSRYVLNILDSNGYKIPDETREQALSGLKDWLNGRRCVSWWDQMVRDNYKNEERILIMETLSRYHALDLKLLSTQAITPNLWRTPTVVAWLRLLRHETAIPNRVEKMTEAEKILRARVHVQGTLMNLQGSPDREANWRLFSSRDQEALDVFGLALDLENWRTDIGRLARGVVTRMNKGAWDTTMANAWGVTHLRRFSSQFEKEKVSGHTKAEFSGESATFNWLRNPAGSEQMMRWPQETHYRQVPVRFSHSGSGRPWITLQTRSAIPLTRPWDMGYSVHRKVTPVSQKVSGKWTNGDVANVELTVKAKSDQAWVVVRDPVPSGASILGAGLEDASNILDKTHAAEEASAAEGGGWGGREVEIRPWQSEYDERSLASFTSYVAYLPGGSYRLSYRVRLNSAGEFKLPPTRVEAMYAPETFAESPNEIWTVAP